VEAQVSAISSTVMPCLMAWSATRMASPAFGATRLTPRTQPVARCDDLDQGAGPLPLRVPAYHDGLPPLPQLTALPEDLTWSRRLPNATIVATGHQV
jgi:hypothetical protein